MINFFFQKPTLKWQSVILKSACIWDMSYEKKWSAEQSGWKQWGISALVWKKRFVEEKTVITPLYSHSDGRGQPLLVSMVCVSKEYSWYRKGWEPLSQSFSNWKGMIEIQKNDSKTVHTSIFILILVSQAEGCSLVRGLEELSSDFPWFNSNVAPGSKPRVPSRRGEIKSRG